VLIIGSSLVLDVIIASDSSVLEFVCYRNVVIIIIIIITDV